MVYVKNEVCCAHKNSVSRGHFEHKNVRCGTVSVGTKMCPACDTVFVCKAHFIFYSAIYILYSSLKSHHSLTQAVLWSPLNYWNAVLCSSYAWLLYCRTEMDTLKNISYG